MAGSMNSTPETTQSLSDHFLNSGIGTYLGVVAFSLWGGLTRFFQNKGSFSWRNLLAQITSSSFAGILTSLACQYANINGTLSGALVGVAAYMGTPALIALAMRLKPVRNLIEPDKESDKETNEYHA